MSGAGEEFIGGGGEGLVVLVNTTKDKTWEGNYGQFHIEIKPGEQSHPLSRSMANSFMNRSGGMIKVLDLNADNPLQDAEEANLETRPNHAKSLYEDDEDEAPKKAPPAKSAKKVKGE